MSQRAALNDHVKRETGVHAEDVQQRAIERAQAELEYTRERREDLQKFSGFKIFRRLSCFITLARMPHA